MPRLHLDDVPEELYRSIEELAVADRVPVGEETLRLLRQAVQLKQPFSRENVGRLLEEMRRNQIVPRQGTPDSIELLREDRNR